MLLFGPVDADHNHLGQTWTGSNNPLKIQGAFGAPDYAPLVLSNSTGDGMIVVSTGGDNDGVHVQSSGDDGVEVISAGDDGVVVGSAGGDGVRVSEAGGDGLSVGFVGSEGLYVRSAGDDGVHVYSAGGDGVEVVSAGGDGVVIGSTGSGADGVHVNSAGDDGVEVVSAGETGVEIVSAGQIGVFVGSAGETGVFVNRAGTPSSYGFSGIRNGFQVAGSQGNGLFVGRADGYGVRVSSTGWDGVSVDSAGWDGVNVNSAGSDGVNAAGTNYAGYFAGNIYVTGNCIGCLQANFAVNAGGRTLEPGDVVSIQAVTPTDFDAGATAWQVVAAQPGQAIVGVVAERAELVVEEEHRSTETGKRLVPREGAAQPGEYVTIVYSGPMQVKVAAGDSAIAAGTRLTAATDGSVRPLQTRTVEGMVVTEGAPVVGVALEPAKNGMVWVLVNPQ